MWDFTDALETNTWETSLYFQCCILHDAQDVKTKERKKAISTQRFNGYLRGNTQKWNAYHNVTPEKVQHQLQDGQIKEEQISLFTRVVIEGGGGGGVQAFRQADGF